MSTLDVWLARLAALEERLRPIASRTIDFNDLKDPAWRHRLAARSPLDEAGVRDEAQELLEELVHAYAAGDASQREIIRGLLQQFRYFAWAAKLRASRSTPAGLRAHLLHFSMLDQGRDPRDATLSLDALLHAARSAGVDAEPALREVAALSNPEHRAEWGATWPSTRAWLLERLKAR